ncbi:hypothetical protein [Holospora curviuscula]|nr:hypothetical protein [Holospora curviuscula]
MKKNLTIIDSLVLCISTIFVLERNIQAAGSNKSIVSESKKDKKVLNNKSGENSKNELKQSNIDAKKSSNFQESLPELNDQEKQDPPITNFQEGLPELNDQEKQEPPITNFELLPQFEQAGQEKRYLSHPDKKLEEVLAQLLKRFVDQFSQQRSDQQNERIYFMNQQDEEEKDLSKQEASDDISQWINQIVEREEQRDLGQKIQRYYQAQKRLEIFGQFKKDISQCVKQLEVHVQTLQPHVKGNFQTVQPQSRVNPPYTSEGSKFGSTAKRHTE